MKVVLAYWRSIYLLRYIEFAKLLTENKDVLSLPERRNEEHGTVKKLGISHLDFRVLWMFNDEDVFADG